MSSPPTSDESPRKSTKRSAAKTPRRRRKPLTFYVDECLGRTVVGILQSEGYDVRPFDEFAGVPDVHWLPVIGERQWILLTKDKNIRKNQLEIDAILNAGVRAFVVTATNLHRDVMSALLLRAMPKIVRICQRRGSFIYNITATGIVSEISTRTLRRRSRRRRK